MEVTECIQKVQEATAEFTEFQRNLGGKESE